MIVFPFTSKAVDLKQRSSKFSKNQKVRRKSEKCSNFRNVPDFSEDLVTLFNKYNDYT